MILGTDCKLDKGLQLLKETLYSKNKMYGDSFSDTYKKYGNSVLLIRLEDKLKRLYTLLMTEETNNAESILDNFLDLAGYSMLAYSVYEE